MFSPEAQSHRNVFGPTDTGEAYDPRTVRVRNASPASFVRIATFAALVVLLLSCGERERTFGDFPGYGTSFRLTDQRGRSFSSEDLNGHVGLLFFGYTSCPQACPATLQKIRRALEDLPDGGEGIRVVFISVDPRRDTPARLREYLRYYAPGTTGLTGPREELDRVVDAYRAYYEVHREDSAMGYSIDHSLHTYLLDPDGKVVHLFRFNDTVKELSSVLMQAREKWPASFRTDERGKTETLPTSRLMQPDGNAPGGGRTP